MQATEGTVFDSEVLPSALETTDEALLREFYALYMQQLEELRTSQSEAARAGDLHTIGLLAHKLKSSSLAVGAMRLGELLGQLEVRCQAPESTGFPELLSQVDTTIEKTMAALAARLDRPKI